MFSLRNIYVRFKAIPGSVMLVHVLFWVLAVSYVLLLVEWLCILLFYIYFTLPQLKNVKIRDSGNLF